MVEFQGAVVRTPQGREETVRPSKFEGRRAGRGTVVLKRGRFAEWNRPTLRYDLESTITDDDDDAPDGEGGPPSGGGNDSSGGSSDETGKTAIQQGLGLPMGPGGDA